MRHRLKLARGELGALSRNRARVESTTSRSTSRCPPRRTHGRSKRAQGALPRALARVHRPRRAAPPPHEQRKPSSAYISGSPRFDERCDRVARSPSRDRAPLGWVGNSFLDRAPRMPSRWTSRSLRAPLAQPPPSGTPGSKRARDPSSCRVCGSELAGQSPRARIESIRLWGLLSGAR